MPNERGAARDQSGSLRTVIATRSDRGCLLDPPRSACALVFAVLAGLCAAVPVRADTAAQRDPLAGTEEAPADGEPTYVSADASLFTVVGLGLLHHVDHVLRDNHSGFPFRRRVTPFTASLLVYPILLAPYFLDGGPLANLVSMGVVFLATSAAHIFAEPPREQYDPWVDGTNRLGLTSPAVGRTSQAISTALSGAIVANIVANVVDGVRYGFTWKRMRGVGRSRTPAVLPHIHRDGASIMVTTAMVR